MVEARAEKTKSLVDRTLQAQQSASDRHPYLKILELSPDFQDVELQCKKELASLLHPKSIDGTVAHFCGGWHRVCQASCLLDAAVKDAERWLCSRSTASSQCSDDSGLKHRLWEVALDSEFRARKLLRDLESKLVRPNSKQQATRQPLQEDARSTQTAVKMLASMKRQQEPPQKEPTATLQLQPRKKRRAQGDFGSPRQKLPEVGHGRQEGAEQQATAKVQEPGCHTGCLEECEQQEPGAEQAQQTTESNLQFALRKQKEEYQRLQAESQKTQTSQPTQRSDAHDQPEECPASSDKSSCAQTTSDLPCALCRGEVEADAASARMARHQPAPLTGLIGQVTEVLLNCATQHGQGFSGVSLEEFCRDFRQLVGESLEDSVLLVQEPNLLCFLRKWPEQVELFMDTETCSWMLQPCATVRSSQQQQLMRAS